MSDASPSKTLRSKEDKNKEQNTLRVYEKFIYALSPCLTVISNFIIPLVCERENQEIHKVKK